MRDGPIGGLGVVMNQGDGSEGGAAGEVVVILMMLALFGIVGWMLFDAIFLGPRSSRPRVSQRWRI